jgi:UDPglucose 6-dehydrogenase
MYQPLKGAAALVLVTEWPQFKEPDFEKIKNLLAKPVIFDGRNIYSPDRMKSLGFNYFSIGRPTV